MRERDGLLKRFGPLWILVAVMVFLFFTSTLPAIRGNRELKGETRKRQREIELLQNRIEQSSNMLRALRSDPITVENELRKTFGGAKRPGETLIEGQE